MNVGKRIKELRETHGLSQNKLAKLAGIAQSSLSYIEKAAKSPSTETIKTIAIALGVSQSYLLGENQQLSDEPSLPPKLDSLVKAAHTLPEKKLNVLIETAKAMQDYSDNR